MREGSLHFSTNNQPYHVEDGIHIDVMAVHFSSLLFHLALQSSNSETSIPNSSNVSLTISGAFTLRGAVGYYEELGSIVVTSLLLFISFLSHAAEKLYLQ